MIIICGTIIALLLTFWLLKLDARITDIENNDLDEFWGNIPYDWGTELEVTVKETTPVRSDGTDGSWAGD